MWSSAANARPEDDERVMNDMLVEADRKIADITEQLEPLIPWDGACGIVQVRDEEIVKECKAPFKRGGKGGIVQNGQNTQQQPSQQDAIN